MKHINKFYISHRGNINGKNLNSENNPDYVDTTIQLSYHVEIDVWKIKNKLYLGHDEPQYNILLNWLIERSNRLWIHCKNEDSLFYLYDFKELNVFYHTNDEFTFSSKNIILINPYFNTKYKNGILMMPEYTKYSLNEIFKFKGIITDDIHKYENNSNIIRK
jgi:hypothetical protein